MGGGYFPSSFHRADKEGRMDTAIIAAMLSILFSSSSNFRHYQRKNFLRFHFPSSFHRAVLQHSSFRPSTSISLSILFSSSRCLDCGMVLQDCVCTFHPLFIEQFSAWYRFDMDDHMHTFHPLFIEQYAKDVINHPTAVILSILFSSSS